MLGQVDKSSSSRPKTKVQITIIKRSMQNLKNLNLDLDGQEFRVVSQLTTLFPSFHIRVRVATPSRSLSSRRSKLDSQS